MMEISGKITILILIVLVLIPASLSAKNFAIDFDGTGYADIEEETIYNFGDGDFTIEAIISLHHSVGNFANIVCKNGGKAFYTLGIYRNSQDVFFGIGGNDGSEAILRYKLETGEWYHIAGVRDEGYMYLFINGELEGFTSSVANVNSDVRVSIGNARIDLQSPFPGEIDEVRIWNIARNEDQILEAAFMELSGKKKSGLIGLWHFNNGKGDEIKDSSPQKNDGQLHGEWEWFESDPDWIEE